MTNRACFVKCRFAATKKIAASFFCLICVFSSHILDSGFHGCAKTDSPFSVFADEITFHSNSMTGIAGNTSDRTTLLGNAYVRTSQIEIFADKIDMSGKDFRIVEAVGHIRGKNLKTHMEFTCDQMVYDRDTRIATLRNKVHLVDSENNVVADAENIEYDQDADIAILQINITLTQKDNVCKGAYAVYRKKEQMLNLSGNAQITQGKDSFRAQEITLNLDTQQITLDGRVRGSVTDERTDDKNKESESDASKKENEASTGGANDAGADASETSGENTSAAATSNKSDAGDNGATTNGDTNNTAGTGGANAGGTASTNTSGAANNSTDPLIIDNSSSGRRRR